MTADQKYYKRHRAKIREKQRAYYQRTRRQKIAYQRAYYKTHQEWIRKRTQLWWKRTKKARAKVKRAWRLRQYGITLNQHTLARKKQNNRCAICLKRLPKYPATDHSHKTGKFRALLCHSCNRGLGFFQEHIPTLRRAIRYVKTHAH